MRVKTYRLPDEIVKKMRDWIIDCLSNEDEIEYANSISTLEVIYWVNRNYDGGVEQFLKDAE